MLDDLRSALNAAHRREVRERVQSNSRARPAAPDLNDETANPMTNNRNTILAVILSGLVLIAWQYFYNVPQMEKQRVEAQKQAELVKPAAGNPRRTPGRPPGAPPGSAARRQPHRAPQAGTTPRPRATASHRRRDAARYRARRHPARQDRQPEDLPAASR